MVNFVFQIEKNKTKGTLIDERRYGKQGFHDFAWFFKYDLKSAITFEQGALLRFFLCKIQVQK